MHQIDFGLTPLGSLQLNLRGATSKLREGKEGEEGKGEGKVSVCLSV